MGSWIASNRILERFVQYIKKVVPKAFANEIEGHQVSTRVTHLLEETHEKPPLQDPKELSGGSFHICNS
ncbi:PRELI/MSF1 domain-containing protein [Bacillus sp. IT-79MI2]|nr:hypothetical protein BTH41_00549 [Bacillus mycoides]